MRGSRLKSTLQTDISFIKMDCRVLTPFYRIIRGGMPPYGLGSLRSHGAYAKIRPRNDVNLILRYNIFVKKILLFLVFFIGTIVVKAAAIKDIANNLPQMKSVSCTFKQQKTFGNTVLNSGGDFQFIENKGVVFKTKYPIQSTTTYSSASNKQINEIILAISNKNYSYLEKNFDVSFEKLSGGSWNLDLTPKNSAIKAHLKSIFINGDSNIKRIVINSVNNGKTDISFVCGK